MRTSLYFFILGFSGGLLNDHKLPNCFLKRFSPAGCLEVHFVFNVRGSVCYEGFCYVDECDAEGETRRRRRLDVSHHEVKV